MRLFKQKRKYDIEIEDVTPNELRSSKILNWLLVAISVNFTSVGGINYNLHHVYRSGRENPSQYMLLVGDARDEEDFKGVEKKVMEITNSRAMRNFSERYENELCDSLEPRLSLTQDTVADFVEKYGKNFKEVKISKVHFDGVTESALKDSGFPKDKITCLR